MAPTMLTGALHGQGAPTTMGFGASVISLTCPSIRWKGMTTKIYTIKN